MFEQMLQGLISKVRLMVGRAVLSAMRYDGDIHRAQLHLMADEMADDVEVMQQYGYSSAPKPGAEAAVIFIGGNRDAGIVIATHDRRYRLALEAGEVALHDDIGQVVHLKRNGVLIESPNEVEVRAPLAKVVATTQVDVEGPVVRLVAATKVRAETPLLECTGAIKDLCDLPTATTMADMREAYNGHGHSENNVLHGLTDGPNQDM